MLFVVLFCGIGLSGCKRATPPPVAPQPLPSGEFIIHEISTLGENLGLISLWYTGDHTLWRNMFIPASSGTVRRMKTGDRVLIPINIIKRFEPLDKEFIKANRPRFVSRPVSNGVGAEAEAELPQPLEGEPTSTDLEDEFLDTIVN